MVDGSRGGHGRSHGARGHDHSVLTRHRGRLAAVLAITLTILAVEVAGGLITGSLVLLADAAHMAVDALGIGLSLLAAWFAGRPPTLRRTFGYQRGEILAALVNAMLLFGVAGFILYEAVRRLSAPAEVTGPLVMAFGGIALAGNACSLLLLRGGQSESLNVRGAFLEVFSDLLGAAAAVVTGLMLWITGVNRLDAVVAALIAALILPRTWRLLREALDVLLEATPKDVDLGHVRAHIMSIPGVVDVHDLHAWMITSGLPVLSAHVVVHDEVLARGGPGPVLDRLGACLAHHFDVEHCTFQVEPMAHRDHENATHA